MNVSELTFSAELGGGRNVAEPGGQLGTTIVSAPAAGIPGVMCADRVGVAPPGFDENLGFVEGVERSPRSGARRAAAR